MVTLGTKKHVPWLRNRYERAGFLTSMDRSHINPLAHRFWWSHINGADPTSSQWHTVGNKIRYSEPECKRESCFRCILGAVPNGTLAKPTLEVLIWILSGCLRFVKGKPLWLVFDQKMYSVVFIEDITSRIPYGTPTFIKDLGAGALVC